MSAPFDIQAEARRILETPRGAYPLCTWVGSVEKQREAAQRALDGDTDDLDMMLDMDAAELWLRSDDYADEWIANWQPRAAESYIPGAVA